MDKHNESARKAKRPRGRPRKTPPAPAYAAADASPLTQAMDTSSLAGQPEEIHFALDIGTRTVVGVAGVYAGGRFTVLDFEQMEHPGRAMFDGQVEDIAQVAALIRQVKGRLESRLGFRLERVAVAAAGRMLRTVRAKAERVMEPRDLVGRDIVLGLEGEAIELAQAQAQKPAADDGRAGDYYCVGYSVVEYRMDGQPVTQLLGHICAHASVELIAAFLPNSVVEGLYAAVDASALEVVSLTLEPIAAMNLLIPPELRLLNLALVDIGAGTSDIAVCREGVIYSYEMATIAGDEITEAVIRQYLVDFETAEQMKRRLSLGADAAPTITYQNILGVEAGVTHDALYAAIKPTVGQLAKMTADKILACNATAPAAVFLIGGGSQIPGLCEMLAEQLCIDAGNIAVGARRTLKAVDFSGFPVLGGPEFITPLGIAVTAATQDCFHFFGVTVNGKRFKLLNTGSMRCMDVLLMAGFRTPQIIGQVGRSLYFTLNGQRRGIKGGYPEHAVLTINGKGASVDTQVHPGDAIVLQPARHGEPASATVRDIMAGMGMDVPPETGSIVVAGKRVAIGTRLYCNGAPVAPEYRIKPHDALEISSIRTFGDIADGLPPEGRYLFEGTALERGTPLHDGMVIRIAPAENTGPRTNTAMPGAPEPQAGGQTGTQAPPPECSLTLNGAALRVRPGDDQLLLMHLLEYAHVNTENPEGRLRMHVNGREAGFTQRISPGDVVEIGWDLDGEQA